jgi:hypothetical protein
MREQGEVVLIIEWSREDGTRSEMNCGHSRSAACDHLAENKHAAVVRRSVKYSYGGKRKWSS